MKSRLVLAALLSVLPATLHAAEPASDAAAQRVDRYNVVWDQPVEGCQRRHAYR